MKPIYETVIMVSITLPLLAALALLAYYNIAIRSLIKVPVRLLGIILILFVNGFGMFLILDGVLRDISPLSVLAYEVTYAITLYMLHSEIGDLKE